MKDEQQSEARKNNSFTKLIIYIVIFFGVIIFVNMYSPAKLFFYQMGKSIQDVGWYGPGLIVLLNGLLIIPFGLPFSIMEMAVALLIPQFLYAAFINFLSMLVGTSVCFVLGKYVIKDQIQSVLAKQKIYKVIEELLRQKPLRFSLIFRVLLLPYVVKNYGLSLPDHITFSIYLPAATIVAVFYGLIETYIYQSAGNLSNILENSNNFQIIFNLGTLGMSVLLVVYIIWYTKKFIKKLEDRADKVQEVEEQQKQQKNQDLEKKLIENRETEDNSSPNYQNA